MKEIILFRDEIRKVIRGTAPLFSKNISMVENYSKMLISSKKKKMA